jgi:hypothetical protein
VSDRFANAVAACAVAAVVHSLSLQYVFLEEPQRFNAALFRTTAPYLPAGVADNLIHKEEQQRRERHKQEQQQAPATAAP